MRAAGLPLPGADLLALFPNKTWKHATTDENGEATVDLHTTHLPMTIFASAPGHAARLERDWTPSQGALAVELEALPEGGSIIFSEAAGYLPGLKGRLNPIRDTLTEPISTRPTSRSTEESSSQCNSPTVKSCVSSTPAVGRCWSAFWTLGAGRRYWSTRKRDVTSRPGHTVESPKWHAMGARLHQCWEG